MIEVPADLPKRNHALKFYSAVLVQYLGQELWRVGLVPGKGRAEWVEGLPFEEVHKILDEVRGRVRRVEYDDRRGA